MPELVRICLAKAVVADIPRHPIDCLHRRSETTDHTSDSKAADFIEVWKSRQGTNRKGLRG